MRDAAGVQLTGLHAGKGVALSSATGHILVDCRSNQFSQRGDCDITQSLAHFVML